MKTKNLQRVAIACGAVWLGFAAEEVSAAIPASERAALIALYNSTNGAGWWFRTNWRNANDTDFAPVGTECTWEGVTCAGSGHVETLSLYGNNLLGVIPPEIGNLTALAYLDLADNPLTGSIPAEIGNLTNLQSLELWNHQGRGQQGEGQLDGSIPPEIGRLTNLRGLALEGNRLSGPIPAEIGNLTQLGRLNLDHNNLSGSIPAEIGDLTQLVYLHLAINDLTGPIPPGIGNLTLLEDLSLSTRTI